MVDWKKEIKLSDLVGRKKKAEDEPAVEETLELPKEEPRPVAPEPVEAAAPPTPTPEPPAPVFQPLTPLAPSPPSAPALPSIPDLTLPPPAPATPPPAAEPPAVEPEPAEAQPPAEPAPTPAPVEAKSVGLPSVGLPSSLQAPPTAPAPPPAAPIRAATPAAPETPEPKPEKTPLLKREISFRRKKKDKAPKAKAEPKAAQPRKDKQPKERKEAKPPKSGERAKRVRRLVGLKVGASQLAAARVVNNGSPELVQVARSDLERGVVVGGELREPELLAEALKEFFRKNKLPRQNVRLGIANNRIGVRIFEIAGVDEPKQLENAIRYRAQEVLPIPMEEAVLDYQVLAERPGEDGTTVRRILLVVAYRELIERYVAACKKAGIKLSGIDLEAFALLRALGAPPAHDDPPASAALVVVAIGHDRSTFAVSDGRACEFTRVLDWGGSALDVALARTLDVTPSEAEPIKRALVLGDHGPLVEGLTEERSREAREAVRRQLQAFARELVSSLQFYQNQPGSLGIGEIVLTGGTAHLAGLAAELERLIGVHVRVGDPLERVKVGRRVRDREQIGSLAVAIGLGIED